MTILLGFEWSFSPALVERLGWALIHSLWQLAVGGLLASVLLLAMRRSSAVARYNVLAAVLAVSVAAPIVTWMLLPSENRQTAAPVHPTVPSEAPLYAASTAAPAIPAVPLQFDTEPVIPPDTDLSAAPLPEPRLSAKASAQPTNWVEQATTAPQPWLSWLVLAWCVGVALCALRPLLGWYTLRRLRRVGLSPVPNDVLATLSRVSRLLGLRRTVPIFQSSLARTPAVLGYFRPVILLPLSLAAGIPPAQLEAILAHELAHVRRHDFAINLLQTLVETLYFYHPAVWWLSRQIRIEREYCCDDCVVELLGNRVEYGRALVALEELRGRQSTLALGVADGSLVARIRRILSLTPDQSARGSHGLSLAVLFVLICGVGWGVALMPNITSSEATASEPDDVQPQPAEPAVVQSKPQLGLGQRQQLVAWSPDSQYLFGTISGGKLTRWEQKNATWTPATIDADRHANSLAISPRTGLVITGTNSGTVQVWNGAKWHREQEIKIGPEYSIYAVTISPDEKLIANCGTDGTVHIYERSAQRRIALLGELGPTRMTSLAFAPDGSRLAALDRYGKLVLWSIPQAKSLGEWQLKFAGEESRLYWSPDGEEMAVGGFGRVEFIPAKRGSTPRVSEAPAEVLPRYPQADDESLPSSGPMPGGIKFASLVALGPDFRTAASVAPDASVVIWNTANRQILQTLPAPDKTILSDALGGGLQQLTFSPDGRQLAGVAAQGDLVIWNMTAMQIANEDQTDPEADVLARKVSLTAEAMPLREALEKLAAAAKVELVIDAEAIKEVELDFDEPVSVTIKEEPLADALTTLIHWEQYLGAMRYVSGNKLVITTLTAWQAEIQRHLPDWLQVHYNRGLLARLDENHQVVSITAGEIINDELLGRLATLPHLNELYIETTKNLTPAGIAQLSKFKSLRKLSLYSLYYDKQGLGDAAIASIVGLKSLRELSLGTCGTTDAGVRLLEQMPWLTRLELNGEGRLSDASLQSIGKLTELRVLSLSSYVATEQLGRMKFTADGVRQLTRLKRLEELHLVGHSVPADALDFPKLKALSLGLGEVDDACAERIAQLPELTSLVLSYTKISDAGLQMIAGLPKLQRLDMDSYVITDAGLGHLRKLTNLQHISLRASNLTDATLRHLAEIKSLQRIDLHGSGEPGVNAGKCFSMQGVRELRSLPKLRVLWLTNVTAEGGYGNLQELKQLRELTMMMCDLREDEHLALLDALPNTVIHHATGGGGYSMIQPARRKPAKQPPKQPETAVPAPPPDLRLTGDEVTSETIAQLAGRDWGTVALFEARLTGEIVDRLRRAKSIRELRLYGTGLSGQLPRLEHVPGLLGLDLGTPLTGRDLEAIGQLTQLESLSLPQELTINVSGARELARLVRLKALRLYNVNIDDAAFVELQTLTSLEELDLSHTRITDTGLATIEKMPKLRTLELHRHPDWHTKQQLTDACLKSISRLSALERLSLSGKVTNEGLKQVGQWPKLKSLSLISTEITSAGLPALGDSNVEMLSLSAGQLTDEQSVEHLKKCRKLKHVHVVGDRGNQGPDWSRLLPDINWSFTS